MTIYIIVTVSGIRFFCETYKTPDYVWKEMNKLNTAAGA